MGGAGLGPSASQSELAPYQLAPPTIKDGSGTSKTCFILMLPSSPEDIHKPAGLQRSMGQRIAENSKPKLSPG
jgi:hypothetical protein